MPSFEDAVKVNSIAEEREFVTNQRCECGGQWTWKQQSLIFSKEKVPYDRIDVECKNCGKTKEFWFDCSLFFGKANF